MKRLLSNIIVFIPWLFFTLLLLVLVAMQVWDGVLVPTWLAWLIGLGWAIVALDYALRFELFKQIGGLFIILLAIVLVIGATVPLPRIEAAPRVASDQLVDAFESTWNAVYQGKLFRHFSPKQMISDTLRGFGRVDPFRGGRMFMLALFGFSVAASLLFPYEPPKRRSLAAARNYWRRLGGLLLAASAFAAHLELLQVLTRTRTVTVPNLIENLVGVWLGFILFVPVQWAYAALAERRRHQSRRFNVLGVGVDAVNMQDCCAIFEDIITADPPRTEPAMASALGVAGIVAARRDPKLQRILNRCVLNTPDGMPLVWLGKLYGYEQIERVYGPDLLRDICAYSAEDQSEAGIDNRVGRAHRASRSESDESAPIQRETDIDPQSRLGESPRPTGQAHEGDTEVAPPEGQAPSCPTPIRAVRRWKHYFYGAAPGIVEKLQAELERKHPDIQIVGIKCPPFRPLTADEERALVAEIAAVKPDIFWIGISTPKQLYLMDAFRQKLDCKIICPVGYAFDVNAGVEIDAPDWVKYAGLQWLHRGIKQPRLWKRYLPDNPRFVFEVLLQILRLKKYPMQER